MSVANTKSTAITNNDATPPVMNARNIDGGVVREKVGTLEIAAADCANSVFRMVRVHSSWRISDIIRYNDAITSGSSFHVGLYETAENGGAAANANAYADAISLTSASVTGTHDLYEAGSDKGVEKIEQLVWQDAGQTSDPNKWYDLCYTGATPGSGAGTLSVRVQYVAGN